MKMVFLPKTKASLRKHYRSLRRGLSSQRRQEAARLCFQKLKALLASKRVLSFDSIQEELSTKAINSFLVQHSSLYLPKVREKDLDIYQITHPKHLIPSAHFFLEPDPRFCKKVSLQSIDLILVPGLAFDKRGVRLGMGGGYYDRLLEKSSAISIGLGFNEQFSPNLLPKEVHDIRLHSYLLT